MIPTTQQTNNIMKTSRAIPRTPTNAQKIHESVSFSSKSVITLALDAEMEINCVSFCFNLFTTLDPEVEMEILII